MKVEYINPFVSGSSLVFEQILGNKPVPGKLSARPQLFTSNAINIVCGVTGDVAGQVIYGLSQPTALKIASRMIGQQCKEFDELVASAIAELANMISGNSITMLSQQGFTSDITPPTIIKGTNVRISSSDIPVIVIPLDIEGFGEVQTNVCLQQKQVQTAA